MINKEYCNLDQGLLEIKFPVQILELYDCQHTKTEWHLYQLLPPFRKIRCINFRSQTMSNLTKLLEKNYRYLHYQINAIRYIIKYCSYQTNQARPSTHTVVDAIKEVAKLWATAGAKGLKVVLPTAWDVHWWCFLLFNFLWGLLGGMYNKLYLSN